MKKYLLSAFGFLLPVAAFAQTGWAPAPATQGPISSVGGTGPGGILYLINQILFWVSSAFWIAAGIFVLYAAYLYLTAGGNDYTVDKAKHQLLYATVAIAIGLMAAGFPYLVNQFLKGQ